MKFCLSMLLAVLLGTVIDLSYAANWGRTHTVQAQAQAPAPAADPNVKRWKVEENQEFSNLLNEEAVYQAKLEAVQARRQAWVLLMRDKYGCNTGEWDAVTDEKGGAFRRKTAKTGSKGE